MEQNQDNIQITYVNIHKYIETIFEGYEKEYLKEALKILNTHYWLFKNGKELAQKHFNFEIIHQRLSTFEPETANSILQDDNYGPIENRANLVIEFILDKIIEGVDQNLKEEYEQKEKNELFCIPVIEYGTNIFPDLNLFMIFSDMNIPETAEEIRDIILGTIMQQEEKDFVQTIENYFKEAWPIYSQNVLNMIEKHQKTQYTPPLNLQLQFYQGEEGQCYPSQKRNPVNCQILNL